jgi:hypothetical protein
VRLQVEMMAVSTALWPGLRGTAMLQALQRRRDLIERERKRPRISSGAVW